MQLTQDSEPIGRTVLVTGASGFIGSHLSARLARAGALVHALSRTARADTASERWWQVDLADGRSVGELFEAIRPQLVFHLASRVSGGTELELVEPMLEDNLVSALNVMSAAQRCSSERVVLAGTMLEEAAGGVPISPYAAAKSAAAAYARMFHALYATPVVNLRLHMVYGPGQDSGKLIPHVATSLARGRAAKVSSGRRQVDWIYVDDVVDALVVAGCAPGIEGEAIDIGSGELVTIRALVERLAAIVGGAGAEVEFGGLDDRPLEDPRVADVARSSRLMGWQPRTTLEAGLRETADWYRARVEAGELGPG